MKKIISSDVGTCEESKRLIKRLKKGRRKGKEEEKCEGTDSCFGWGGLSELTIVVCFGMKKNWLGSKCTPTAR